MIVELLRFRGPQADPCENLDSFPTGKQARLESRLEDPAPFSPAPPGVSVAISLREKFFYCRTP
jgi:hypothetical protein